MKYHFDDLHDLSVLRGQAYAWVGLHDGHVTAADMDAAMQFALDWLTHHEPHKPAAPLPSFIAALAITLGTYRGPR
jgi:hypothetical protein